MTGKWIGRAVTVTVCTAIGIGATHAAGPATVQWNEVCRVAGNRQLSITTQKGETIQGYCTAITVNEISLTTKDQRVVKIARSALARIRAIRVVNTKGHALASLGKGMHEGLRSGFGWLLSPAAPVGLVVVPGTLAWGAIAAPFCLIGDLVHVTRGGVEIEEINVL